MATPTIKELKYFEINPVPTPPMRVSCPAGEQMGPTACLCRISRTYMSARSDPMTIYNRCSSPGNDGYHHCIIWQSDNPRD